jgi:hypothetical protein
MLSKERHGQDVGVAVEISLMFSMPSARRGPVMRQTLIPAAYARARDIHRLKSSLFGLRDMEHVPPVANAPSDRPHCSSVCLGLLWSYSSTHL